MERARVAKLEALLVRVQKNAAAPRAGEARAAAPAPASAPRQIAAAMIASEPPRAAHAPVAAHASVAPPTPAVAAPAPVFAAPVLGAPTAPIARPVARPAAPPLLASREPLAAAATPTPVPLRVEPPAPIAAAFPARGSAPEIETSEVEASADLELESVRPPPRAPRAIDAPIDLEPIHAAEAPHVDASVDASDEEATRQFEAPRVEAKRAASAPPAEATALAAAMASFKPHAPSAEAAARVAAASRPPEPVVTSLATRDPAGVTPGPVARAVSPSTTALSPAKAERSWGRILLLVALWTIAGVGVAMAYLSTR